MAVYHRVALEWSADGGFDVHILNLKRFVAKVSVGRLLNLMVATPCVS